jgi:hypothetical protein
MITSAAVARRKAGRASGAAGCGEVILADFRVDEYEGGFRVHSEKLACLIAWNERWHTP